MRSPMPSERSRFVILWRNPNNNHVSFVADDAGEMFNFGSRAEAEKAARHTTVCRAFPYQIVDVEA